MSKVSSQGGAYCRLSLIFSNKMLVFEPFKFTHNFREDFRVRTWVVWLNSNPAHAYSAPQKREKGGEREEKRDFLGGCANISSDAAAGRRRRRKKKKENREKLLLFLFPSFPPERDNWSDRKREEREKQKSRSAPPFLFEFPSTRTVFFSPKGNQGKG